MFIKTVYPSALGQKISFSSCVDDAIAAGFSGFWFDPSLDFNISREEMLSLIQLKHILPMGMELPVEFRKDEETFSRDLKRLENIAAYASFIWSSKGRNPSAKKRDLGLSILLMAS